MSPDAVYQLTCKVFWMLWQNIDRLRAEQELRQVALELAMKSEDGVSRFIEALRGHVGDAIVLEGAESVSSDVLDREGLEALRRM